MTSLALACKLNAARTPTSLALRALAAIRRAGGTVLAAGAATPVLGPESLIDPSFNDATKWTAGTGWQVTGGNAVATSVAMSVNIIPHSSGYTPTVAGETYFVEYAVPAATAGSYVVIIWNGSANVTQDTVRTSAGTYTFSYVATNAQCRPYISAQSANTSLVVSSLSQKRLMGYTYGNPPVRNYFDSAGTDILDSVTQVDQPVGLVLDGAGTVGADRVTDGNNESALFAIQGGFVSSDTVARASAPGGGFAASSISTTSASTAHRFYGISPMLAGKTYQLSGRFYVPTGGIGSFKIYDNADGSWFGFSSSTKDQWVPFSVIRTPKATNWDLGIGDYVANVVTAGQVAFWIDDLSITELTGNHATQPTTGSKPTLRRGLVNQLLWSGDFTNAAWTKLNATIEPNAATTPDGYLAGRLVENTANNLHGVLPTAFPVVTSGAIYTLATVVKAAGRTAIYVRDNGSTNAGAYFNLSTGAAHSAETGVVAATSSPLGDGWHLCVVTYTTTSAACNAHVRLVSTGTTVSYTGDGVSGAFVHRCGLFTGTVTAQQIIAAGGIPLTTTAPASSALGNYWWQFSPDAPGDFFSTGISTGATGWMCAGITFSAVPPAALQVLGTTATGGLDGAGLLVTTGGTSLLMSVGNGTTQHFASRSAPAVGVPAVVEGWWDSSTVTVALNGIETSAARSGVATSPGTLTIGARQVSPSAYLNGAIPVTVYCPTLPPPADRALIRAWVAKQQGQTL